MIRLLFLILILLQTIEAQASTALTMPDASSFETAPNSKEIKKMVKLLDDPAERAKLIKALKVLATVQEEEEKKKATPFVDYIMPVIQSGVDTALATLKYIKKIPLLTADAIIYLENEHNRSELWTALLIWFPILVLLEVLFERTHLWVVRRTPKRKKTASITHMSYPKTVFAFGKLFLPFMYLLLYLPLFVSDQTIRNWLIGFLFILFSGRLLIFDHEKQSHAYKPLQPGSHSPTSKYFRGVVVYSLLILLIVGAGMNIWDIAMGQTLFLLPFILFSFPLLLLFFHEWRQKQMPKQLVLSRNLLTAPSKFAPLINILIRYLPWVILIISIPIGIEKVLFEGVFWATYGLETFETLILLVLFLWGRQHIEDLTRFKMPTFQTPSFQPLSSYLSHIQLPFLKIMQLVWHLSFLLLLISVWDLYLSGLFVRTLSLPMMKTLGLLGVTLGVIYLIWFILEYIVDYHTKPQTVRGKRRVPTVFAKTIGPMLHSVVTWVMTMIAIFFSLETFGFDLKVLAFMMGALAFAISLGSQNLVKDIINGFSALIDGRLAIGEVVTVGAHTGEVESLSLRALTLRHKDGSLQTIPFSEVGNVINKSKGYTLIPINVCTSYKTEIGLVYKALSLAAEEMAEDETYGKMILEPLSISGIDHFADSAVHVSASIKVTPDPYNSFGRELNRRLKVHMDALKITPPISFQEEWGKGRGGKN